MGFTVEHKCPQCGAPVELDETDHLLKCPYCGVRNFLFAPDYFRYELPHKAPGRDLIYAPYLRFKGNAYTCHGCTIGHRVVDITHVGLPFNGIPVSLGLRPQALKMKFVTPNSEGSFLKFTLKASDILAKASKLSNNLSNETVYHRAYIGETLSIIYFPFFIEKNRLFDAVLNRPMRAIPGDQDVFGSAVRKKQAWKLTFIATLCPKCGWNLEGERDSVVLTCENCESAWEASKGRFVPVSFTSVPGEGDETVYLPFWRTSVKGKGIKIDSFADFIRITNQPRVVGKEWEKEEMRFWSPAFKIRPKIFLKLSKTFTISQKRFETKGRVPQKNLYPVTLPRTEAIQAVKTILADATLNKGKFLPLLPKIGFDVLDSDLVYLPFTDTGHEMIQQQMGLSINKNSLQFGRKL